MDKTYYVYILSNWNNTLLYIGFTNNLQRRIIEHKSEMTEGFTKKYHIHKLVYYEETNDVYEAIAREKQLKGWTRKKKAVLIETKNPGWNDLLPDYYE
ncbi:MAG: GIY-YIG nuclease family protein [Flexilinea sp.]